MKRINKFLTRSAVAFTLAAMLPSCAMDDPFGDVGEGDLTLTTEINGDVIKTRALSGEELATLREKCIVYIESSRGVVRKYKGVDNIPEQIRLKTGSYVCNAWSGDSVSASFSAKFYRGQQKFEMAEGQNSLTVRCNIANVIASVDPASLDVKLSDLRVTFSHSRGSLDFDENNIPTSKGYFMMPNADKDLAYKIEGKKADGSAFVKEGKIENVQRAHEYCMTISQDDSPVTEGGALIRIEIADIPLIEETVEIFPAPAVRGVDFNIGEQVVSTDRDFKDTRVYVRGYFGLSTLTMNVSDNFTGLASGVNILESSVMTDLESKGVRVERRTSTDASETAEGGQVEVDEVYVTFSKAFLDGLAPSENEYTVTFEATDGRHKTGTGSLRIANDPAAVEHLVPVSPGADPSEDLTSVRAYSAVLTGIVNKADATGFGIKYRKQGASEWTAAYPSSASAAAARRSARSNAGTRAAAVPYTVTLTGLEPSTAYEYIVFCDGYDGENVMTFTTDGLFTLPNASFEEWGTYGSGIIIPSLTGDKTTSFWGTGNEGAKAGNALLTDKSTDMAHSGTYSARLETKKVLGFVIAAGNLFVGEYARTDGTNGVLSLGRTFNGSHPSKVAVWANYRPGTGCTVKPGVPEGTITENGKDHGQIYVALTDEPVEIRTNPKDQKLFDPNDVHVLAYGEVTWTDDFGPDGALQKIEIPFTYNDRAKTIRPTHIVIVSTASKYGDYFSGARGSLMYLDDFELVYE